MANTKKLGLALGGGGPKGIAHIGLLKALEEAEIKPDYISGTSVGALVGALYAFGVPLKEQKEYAQKMTWSTITRFRPSSFALATNEYIKRVVNHFLGDKRLEDSPIPLAIVAGDITNGEKAVLLEGDVAGAIMASSAIPGMFAPVRINGRLLVDGGIIENVPISPLKEMGAEIIVANDLTAGRIKKQPKNVADIINNSFSIMISHSRQYHAVPADLVIKPELSELWKVDEATLVKTYERGYQSGQENIGEIMKLINA